MLDFISKEIKKRKLSKNSNLSIFTEVYLFHLLIYKI